MKDIRSLTILAYRLLVSDITLYYSIDWVLLAQPNLPLSMKGWDFHPKRLEVIPTRDTERQVGVSTTKVNLLFSYSPPP